MLPPFSVAQQRNVKVFGQTSANFCRFGVSFTPRPLSIFHFAAICPTIVKQFVLAFRWLHAAVSICARFTKWHECECSPRGKKFNSSALAERNPVKLKWKQKTKRKRANSKTRQANMRLFLNPDMALSLTLYHSPTLWWSSLWKFRYCAHSLHLRCSVVGRAPPRTVCFR